jgi:hypothetical protein
MNPSYFNFLKFRKIKKVQDKTS